MPEAIPTVPVDTSVYERDFKYYIFDWDDNILKMPTAIHMERRTPQGLWVPQDVSTSLFSVIRKDTRNYRPPQGNWSIAFRDFLDDPQDGGATFLKDTAQALEQILSGRVAPPPSFRVFRDMLIEGRLFAIVTARGHSSATIRQGVKLFVERVLSLEERSRMMASLRGYRHCFDHLDEYGSDEEELERYLSLCPCQAVKSPEFRARFGGALGGGAEESKRFAIREFVLHIVHILERTGASALKRNISIGFSDDDASNVAAVEAYIEQELSRAFPDIRFCVYDTSDGDAVRKIVVSDSPRSGR